MSAPRRGGPPGRGRGYILVTVVVTLFILSSIALLLNRESGLNLAALRSEQETAVLGYVAEAGLKHALWSANAGTCSGYGLPVTQLGEHSYSAIFTPSSGSPVSIVSTAQLDDGTSRALRRDAVAIYETPDVLALTPDAAQGKDTSLYEWWPTRNYGAATGLILDANAGSVGHALLQFDVSAVPAGARIISARLELYSDTPSWGSAAVDVHRVTSDWAEGASTGGNGAGSNWTKADTGVAWGSAGGDYDPVVWASTITTGNTEWVDWDIAGLVAEWTSGRAPNRGMLLRTTTPYEGAEFASSDAADAGKRPRLTVTYACECGIGGATGSITLQPGAATKDAFLVAGSNKSDRNTGGGASMWVSTGTAPHHALIEFDLSGLPPGAVAQSALLELYSQSTDAAISAELAVHRVMTAWQEGTGAETGTTPADGASWDAYDGVNAWTTPGGDYDAAIIDSQPVPDLSARWYQFDVSALVADWMSGVHANQGVLVRGSSGSLTKLYIKSGDSSDAALHPKLTINYSCPCGASCSGGGAPPAPADLLLVVDDPGSLSVQDVAKMALIESWGYTVNLLDDGATQSEFDTATLANAVAYVSATVSDTTLGSKLVAAAIGVVSEKANLVDEFGFSYTGAGANRTQIDITDSSHPITDGFALGPLTIHGSAQPSYWLTGTLAPGLAALANGEGNSDPGLAVLESGAGLAAGGTAAGRRVKLPWGGAAFDHGLMNAYGELIMRRAIEWAADGGGGGGAPLAQNPDADSYLRQDRPDELQGAQNEFIVADTNNKRKRPVIHFDTSGVPPGTLVDTATLRLWVSDNRTTTTTSLALYKVSASWTQDDVSWNARTAADDWATAGGDYNALPVDTRSLGGGVKLVWQEFDITALVQEWVDFPASNHGLMIQSDNFKDVKFSSMEAGDPAVFPHMILVLD